MNAELALRELSHRVSNDLAAAASLLRLHRRAVTDTSALHALDDAAAALDAIALVHRAVEPRTDAAGVELSGYLSRLTATLAEACLKPLGVDCRADVEPRFVPARTARALGLITCELVRNAAKHAYPDGRKGTVLVRFTIRDARCRLEVVDDGAGGGGPLTAAGEGARILQRLADSISAELTRSMGTGGSGTRVSLCFGEPDRELDHHQQRRMA